MVRDLDRAVTRNRASRTAHPDDPSPFVDDEVALNDAILGLKDVAAYVGLYPTLVGCGAMGMLLTSLAHENVDVVAAVVGVLAESLDPALLLAGGSGADDDVDDDGTSPTSSGKGRWRAMCLASLANAFVDGDGLDLLSSNLGRDRGDRRGGRGGAFSPRSSRGSCVTAGAITTATTATTSRDRRRS